MFQSTTFHRFGLLRRAQFDYQEQIVAGMATQHRVENPAVQEQVIIQEIPQVPSEERIQEQIVASAPQVVGPRTPA